MNKTEQRIWRQAVWQYLIDHSRPAHKGGFLITFTIPDSPTFWYRVRARARGDFKRTDIKKERKKAEAEAAYRRKRDRIDAGMERLFHTGGWHIRLLFRIRKVMGNYLEKKALTRKD